jgi:hypothetical protein
MHAIPVPLAWMIQNIYELRENTTNPRAPAVLPQRSRDTTNDETKSALCLVYLRASITLR